MAGSPGLTGLSLRARSCAEVGGQLEEVCASSENADSTKAIARPAGRGSAWRMLLMAGSVCWGGGKPWLECRPEARGGQATRCVKEACRWMSRRITVGPGVDDGRERRIERGTAARRASRGGDLARLEFRELPRAWRARADYSPTFCAFARSTISQNRENAIDRRGGALRALRGSGG